MDKDKKYEPISCVFYDFIEHYAIRKEKVNIILKGKDGNSYQVQSRILDTKTREKVEYVLLETTQEWVRMDHLISLNEHVLADYQNC